MPHDDTIDTVDDFPEPEFLEGAAPTSSERTLAMVAHIGGLLMSFVIPAILMVTQQDKSPFVVRHARESVNYQISLFFHSLLIFIPGITVYAALYYSGFKFPIPLLAASLVALAISIPLTIFEVYCIVRACLAAWKGREFRYPLTIRLI